MEINPELETKLRELVTSLLETNEKFNLTSIRDPQEAWNKHILDSLQGLETGVFEGAKKVVDIGAGAGFPGLPLAMARPRFQWSFLEATRKKCGFIDEMRNKFDLNTRILNDRAEVIGHNPKYRAQFEIATARAVGSFMEVAEYCLPLVCARGVVVLWRGKDAEAEVKQFKWPLSRLGGVVRSIYPYQLPDNEMTYHLVVIDKKSPTPNEFPRDIGVPKRLPLES